MKQYLIYRITNKINKKFYIGAHITTEINDNYMGSGEVIIKAIKKYGILNFSKKILLKCSNEEEMYRMERKLVTIKLCNRQDCYNIREGGIGNFTYINNNKLNNKNDNYKKGGERVAFLYYNDPIFRAKCKDSRSSRSDSSFTGKYHTEKTKAIIGRKNKIKLRGKANGSYDTHWIVKDNKELRVKKDELVDYISIGWTRGRKCNHRVTYSK